MSRPNDCVVCKLKYLRKGRELLQCTAAGAHDSSVYVCAQHATRSDQIFVDNNVFTNVFCPNCANEQIAEEIEEIKRDCRGRVERLERLAGSLLSALADQYKDPAKH